MTWVKVLDGNNGAGAIAAEIGVALIGFIEPMSRSRDLVRLAGAGWRKIRWVKDVPSVELLNKTWT